jgi:hypothetical protein
VPKKNLGEPLVAAAATASPANDIAITATLTSILHVTQQLVEAAKLSPQEALCATKLAL